ncbi:Molybdopterin biosynthesis protein CNX1, partial [Cucurbita argyrosperma subsp. sororia]
MADHSTAMIFPDEALRIVLEVAQRLPPFTVSLHDALAKVLAQDIRAPDLCRHIQPPLRNEIISYYTIYWKMFLIPVVLMEIVCGFFFLLRCEPRKYAEVKPTLLNMVAAAELLRLRLGCAK